MGLKLSIAALQTLLLLSSYCKVPLTLAYQNGVGSPAPKAYGDFVSGPVVKSLNRPVLTVIDPITKTRIHLIGVCHGSASSANLVEEIFAEVNPAAVVLELCGDRFLSLSIEAKMRPRFNETLGLLFDDYLAIKHDELKADAKEVAGGLPQSNNILEFLFRQGPISGAIVLLSILGTTLQRIFRFNTGSLLFFGTNENTQIISPSSEHRNLTAHIQIMHRFRRVSHSHDRS